MNVGLSTKTEKFKAAVDLRDSVGKLVSRTNDGGVWLAKKNQPIVGVIKRGAKRGGMVTVQLQGPAPVVQKPLVEVGKMKPGPYTTCRKCKALVAVSDVRESGGYCGNCGPAIVLEHDALALSKYRNLAKDLSEAVINPLPGIQVLGRPSLGDALRALIVYYVQDQLTAKADDDFPELPEGDD
jgi:hypothetical protein